MKNETNVACLVKDFYPKNIKISFDSPKTIKEFEPAIVVSPSGKYSAVKLGQFEDPNSVTCLVQHENERFNSTYFEKSQRRSKRSSGKSYMGSMVWNCGEEKLREREVGHVNS